jgi:hypothetical protein
MTVIYPEAIRTALKPNRSQPARPPKLSAKQPSLIEWGNMSLQLIILLAIGGLSSRFAAWLAILILVIGGIVIILQIRWQVKSLSRREKNYQLRVSSYLINLEKYGISEAHKENPNRLAIALQQYQFVYQISDPIPEISAELVEFDLLLNQKFADRLHRSVIVQFVDSQFQLDWGYIDQDLNLHIAIVISNPKYLIAHQLLLQSGWIILEFSQSELIETPQQSIELVCQTINLCYSKF